MPCEPFITSDGISGFICSRGRRKRCSVAGCRGPGHYLCDHPSGSGRTCSRAVCGHHRTSVGELDYCPEHARAARSLQVQPASSRRLELRCACGQVAPLPCEGRAPSGARCRTVVCHPLNNSPL